MNGVGDGFRVGGTIMGGVKGESRISQLCQLPSEEELVLAL